MPRWKRMKMGEKSSEPMSSSTISFSSGILVERSMSMSMLVERSENGTLENMLSKCAITFSRVSLCSTLRSGLPPLSP